MPDAELLEVDARRLPFEAEFDVVGAFDVLEHIEEDERALIEMHAALRPGGGLVVTVPQHPALWSAVDEYSRHVRRYRRSELLTKLRDSGFEVIHWTSFVSLLLPAARPLATALSRQEGFRSAFGVPRAALCKLRVRMGLDGGEGADQTRPLASGRRIPARSSETTVVEELRKIPFNRPYATGAEYGYIREAIANAHVSGNGPFTRRCTERLEAELGSERVLLTHSCTGALEMAVMLAGVGPGDEVILPSFAFPSLPNAVALRGGVPVFVDIRADTLNLDESLVQNAITDRTRVLAPIDYAGVGCEMDAFSAIARAHGLVVIEDAAQGFGASYQGHPLGSSPTSLASVSTRRRT